MSSPVIPFPAADRRQWQDIVTHALKGASPDSLNRIDEDGLEVDALYQINDENLSSSGPVPTYRLTWNPAHRLAHGWRVCQPVDAHAPAENVNRNILDELSDGATGIYLSLGPVSGRDLGTMLSGVVLGAADIVLDASTDVSDVLAAFQELSLKEEKPLSEIGLDLAIDPFGPQSDAEMLNTGLDILRGADTANLPAGVFRLNGWFWHNQGLSQVQELGYLLAATTQIFRSGMEAGLSASQIAQKTSISLALPADMFDGIAKCRALRRGWSGVIAALGLETELYPLQIQALPSLRMFSLADSDSNILRTTTALLGGAIGGADIMTSHAHDILSGASAIGRRLARMQQIMMIEESNLGRSLDAAGGSGFVESRTDALARAAWAEFQNIEAGGGAKAAQTGQTFISMAQSAAQKRGRKLAAGQLPLLGVTIQPNGKPVPDLLSRWRNLSRPAAVIEVIRKQMAKAPPRILMIQQSDGDDPQVESLRRVLHIGGMSAVHLTIWENLADAVSAARPDIVILVDMSIASLDQAVQEKIDQTIRPGGIFEASDILASTAPITWLIKLAEMTVDDRIS